MSIAGTYVHYHTINPEEFLKAVGNHLSRENIIGFTTTVSTLRWSVRDDVYTLSATIGPFWERRIKFRIGVPFIEGEGEVITIAERYDNVFLLTSITMCGRIIRRAYAFDDCEVVVILDLGNGKLGKRYYKKTYT
ncbi:hypothetical protein QE152_g21791 [Popillia japonica]|uniref:Uncharacterized protein n=1 Tax=Popillia japonica TaxID=7064 RepID=A0AAW1KNX0_POPJA